MTFAARSHLLCLLLLYFACQQASSFSDNGAGSAGGSSSRNTNVYLSPIRNWQASWTASQAQGSAIAMLVRDCLVIFLRSPSTNAYKPTTMAQTTQVNNNQQSSLYGIKVIEIDLSTTSMLQYAPSWIPIGTQSLCVMTGLALDVEHLCRVIQSHSDNYWNIYQKSSPTHSITQRLAKYMQNPCLTDGNRPYGVQAMIIGCDDIGDSESTSKVNQHALCIYSIDPSGTWQSWGKASAIGKFGTEIRRNLAKKLKSSNNNNDTSTITMDLPEAIQLLAECWMETCRQENVNLNIDKEDCQVLILQKDSNNPTKSCLYQVPSKEIKQIIQKIIMKDVADQPK